MNITKQVPLDLRKNTNKIIDIFKQWDKNSRTIEFEILEDGNQVLVDPDKCKAVIAMNKPDFKPILNDCTIKNNTIIVPFTEQMFAMDGIATGEIRIYDLENKTLAITSTFQMRINKSVVDDIKIQSTHEFNALTNIILSNSEAIKKCEDAAQNASNTIEEMDALKSTLVAAENDRENHEIQRIANENQRKANETNRNNALSTALSNCSTATEHANVAADATNSAIASAETATDRANAAAELCENIGDNFVDNLSSIPVSFQQASEFANIQPGDSLATAFGKLSKFCANAENGHMNYWSLSGGTPILPNTDLNTLTGVGNYYCATNAYAGTLQHTPVTTAFTMKNFHGNGTDYLTQQLQILSDGAIWRRVLGTDGSWNSWIRITPSIANNLTTTTSGSVLDAFQGKVLDDKITQLNGNILPKEISVGTAIGVDGGSWDHLVAYKTGNIMTLCGKYIVSKPIGANGTDIFRVNGAYAPLHDTVGICVRANDATYRYIDLYTSGIINLCAINANGVQDQTGVYKFTISYPYL